MDDQSFDRMMQMLVDNERPEAIRKIAIRLLLHVQQGGEMPSYWVDSREDYVASLEKIIQRMGEAILEDMDTPRMLN